MNCLLSRCRRLMKEVLSTFDTYHMQGLSKDGQRLLIRRTLAVVSKSNMLPNVIEVSKLASGPFDGLATELIAEEMAAWYQIEPNPAVRKWLLGLEGRSGDKEFRSVYEIGEKDSDPTNAALAKRKLKELPAK